MIKRPVVIAVESEPSNTYHVMRNPVPVTDWEERHPAYRQVLAVHPPGGKPGQTKLMYTNGHGAKKTLTVEWRTM